MSFSVCIRVCVCARAHAHTRLVHPSLFLAHRHAQVWVSSERCVTYVTYVTQVWVSSERCLPFEQHLDKFRDKVAKDPDGRCG